LPGPGALLEEAGAAWLLRDPEDVDFFDLLRLDLLNELLQRRGTRDDRVLNNPNPLASIVLKSDTEGALGI
jgi:hypothetical protein